MGQPGHGRADWLSAGTGEAASPDPGREADRHGPRPLCFVLMPFGQKREATGRLIDFDAVYRQLIRPAVETAGLEALRADEEIAGGIVHKPMFERLILCDYAMADLTTANANVFYELGVRHAVRPRSTVLAAADPGRLPFDLALDRAMPYSLGEDGRLSDVEGDVARLVRLLRAAREETPDSPIYQLLEDYPNIDPTKAGVFRERVDHFKRLKTRLAEARGRGRTEVLAVGAALGDLDDLEAGVIIDFFLSLRAIGAYGDMVSLVARMPKPIARTAFVQEQLALALNRLERRDEAEEVLLHLLAEHGPSSETYGLLGSVHKGRWADARTKGNHWVAAGFLEQAVASYLKGFEVDLRDPYPGVNAVTLMELQEPPDPRRRELLPVVRFAVQRRFASGLPDYWDYATALEIAVLGRDRVDVARRLPGILAAVREAWEPRSTAGNLELVNAAWQHRGKSEGWLLDVIDALLRRADEVDPQHRER